MGFLNKIGTTAAKLFGGGKAKAPKAGTSSLRPSQGLQPKPSDPNYADSLRELRAKIESWYPKSADQIRQDIENWDFGEKDKPKPEKPKTELARFLSGELMNVVSSNVDSVQWIEAEETLYIGYHGGKSQGLRFYWYKPISKRKATMMWKASSRGKWIWDNLRVRGTVFGHKVEYGFMDGPSTGEPKYHATQKWRAEHGSIPPSGKIPDSWKRGEGPYPPGYG